MIARRAAIAFGASAFVLLSLAIIVAGPPNDQPSTKLFGLALVAAIAAALALLASLD